MLVVLLSCAPRMPADLLWLDLPRCAMPPNEVAACSSRGGEPGRPLSCAGVVLPEPTRAEERAEERSYRTARSTCVCITPVQWAECAATP